MAVWRLKTDDENYQHIHTVRDVDMRFFDRQQGLYFRDKWASMNITVQITFYDWRAEESAKETPKPIGDFSIIMLDFLACSERALTYIQPLIDSQIRFLPMEYKDTGERWYVMDNLPIVDCLDYEASKFLNAMFIKRHVFKSDCSTNLFKLPLISHLYVSDEFKSAVEGRNLKGLLFQQLEGVEFSLPSPYK